LKLKEGERKIMPLQKIAALVLLPLLAVPAAELFEMQDNVKTRWASFENLKGEKGSGGMANLGAKGAAFSAVRAGETKIIMAAEGAGTIRRMWFTIHDRSPEALRSFVLRMYWDGEEKPAVEAPFGDFFGATLGRATAFESELFSNPEGRSFNCFIPMPFRTGAKVTFTNESASDLSHLFYDIDYTLTDAHPEDILYFHTVWRRERWTSLGRDFAILPEVSGSGRFLGAHIGVIEHPDNRGWWGEGEVKIYLDGDTDYPTLAGTGTEDYIGTAWGQGEFAHRYQGCLLMDTKNRMYTFYRYHVPDPVFFHQDIRITIQQMGGAGREETLDLLEKGVDITPVSVNNDDGFFPLLDPPRDVTAPDAPAGWTNMYRRDDVCATALFYLDSAANSLPPLASLEERTEAIAVKEE
jgi:hypothetical protein